MPIASWDTFDLDDYGSLEGWLEGPRDWDDPAIVEMRSGIDREIDAVDTSLSWSIFHRAHRDEAPPELTTPTNEPKRFMLLEHAKGQTYIRSQEGWQLNGSAFTFGPIVGRLETQLLQRLRKEDWILQDPAEMVRRAWVALALGHLDRVVELTVRVTRGLVRPPTAISRGAVVAPQWRAEVLAAAAMLCSARRQLQQSDAALEGTDIFADEDYPPLMTSRAAAMCDLGRWEEGSHLALRSRDLQASVEVSRLLDRIRDHAARTESRLDSAH